MTISHRRFAGVNGAGGLAEGEGFEPPVRFPVQWFSRPPVSTAHASLRGCLKITTCVAAQQVLGHATLAVTDANYALPTTVAGDHGLKLLEAAYKEGKT